MACSESVLTLVGVNFRSNDVGLLQYGVYVLPKYIIVILYT